jgi:hypothetical protein
LGVHAQGRFFYAIDGRIRRRDIHHPPLSKCAMEKSFWQKRQAGDSIVAL